MRGTLALLLWLLAVPVATHAQPAASVQLVLAVDASGSVDAERFELQKHGYAEAFRSAAVQAAIRGTATGAIAVAMTQWTGPAMHVDVVPWTLLDGPAAATAFAAAIDAAPRALFGGGTSISGAIDHAMALFPQSRWPAARKVIDVSGDGDNNRGRPAEDARNAAVAAGVTINGLPILELQPNLDDYYRHNVIGGAGAFVIAAAHYDAFAAAIRNKLVVEIAGRPLLPREASHRHTRALLSPVPAVPVLAAPVLTVPVLTVPVLTVPVLAVPVLAGLDPAIHPATIGSTRN